MPAFNYFIEDHLLDLVHRALDLTTNPLVTIITRKSIIRYAREKDSSNKKLLKTWFNKKLLPATNKASIRKFNIDIEHLSRTKSIVKEQRVVNSSFLIC